MEIASELSFPYVKYFIWDSDNSKILMYLKTAIALFMQYSKLCMISVNQLKIIKVHSGWWISDFSFMAMHTRKKSSMVTDAVEYHSIPVLC